MLKSVFNACLKYGYLQFKCFLGTRSRFDPAVFQQFNMGFARLIKPNPPSLLIEQLTPAAVLKLRNRRSRPCDDIKLSVAKRAWSCSRYAPEPKPFNFFPRLFNARPVSFGALQKYPPLRPWNFDPIMHCMATAWNCCTRLIQGHPFHGVRTSRPFTKIKNLIRSTWVGLENAYKAKFYSMVAMSKSFQQKRMNDHHRFARKILLPVCIEECLLNASTVKGRKWCGGTSSNKGMEVEKRGCVPERSMKGKIFSSPMQQGCGPGPTKPKRVKPPRFLTKGHPSNSSDDE